MNKNKLIELRCKAWGITEDEYYCNQCSDFSLEDMARAYRRGKNKGRADLEKENAELDCQKNRNKSCYSCANATERCFRNEIACPCQKYKSYKEENAELKEKLKPENCLKLLAKGGYVKFSSDQLTYAKTIIQDLLDNTDEYARQKAEDFLKENK